MSKVMMQGQQLDDQISVKVPADIKRYLRVKAALENMTSPSDVVRKAIEEYMSSHPLPSIGATPRH